MAFVCFLFCLGAAIMIALEVQPSAPQHSVVIRTKVRIVLELKLMAEIASCFQEVKQMARYYISVFLKSRIEIGLDWKTSMTHLGLTFCE